MRLLAGTGTATGEPPPAGVRVNADTETSKAITLSAGASPKRTCVDEAVVPGVGVGVGLEARDDPPPQPAARAMIAPSMKVDASLAIGLKEVFQI